MVYPGTTIEVVKIEKSGSRRLFEGIFATGGITLSQVCTMTGLEPYMVQNWVKRGFVSSPVKRVYSSAQFARIIIINMMRETLLIEEICELIRTISRSSQCPADDELYHAYVDMIAGGTVDLDDAGAILSSSKHAAKKLMSHLDRDAAASERQLADVLRVMIYAYAASSLARSAKEIILNLE